MLALARAGSELVRVTVNNDEAAAAVPEIVDELDKLGVRVPIIGDFHYNGHLLLKKYPDCARALAKYRINPGNVNIGRKNDDNFRTMIEVAVENDKPVRIGVNWGSLDQRAAHPHDGRELPARRAQGRARSHHGSDGRERAELRASWPKSTACAHDQIILSAKVSGVQDLIDVYRALAARCDYPLHLGLTEAGMGAKGIVATTAGARACCCRKASATPFACRSRPLPNGDRTEEVSCRAADSAVARHPQLHAAGHRLPRLRTHHQHLLPGDGGADPDLPARADAGVERHAIPASKR